ncbi:hypothetical protein MRB53_040010 [Persea americana]|nr:hypothetical protein MRB53_040010 [Persea americana]
MALTVATAVGGRMIGGFGWIDGALTATKVVGSNNIRRMIVPGMILAVALGISYAVSQIPHSLPRRLSAKLAAQLEDLDYTHANSLRISAEVRRALKYPPTSSVRVSNADVESLHEQRRETVKCKAKVKWLANTSATSSREQRHPQPRRESRPRRPGTRNCRSVRSIITGTASYFCFCDG